MSSTDKYWLIFWGIFAAYYLGKRIIEAIENCARLRHCEACHCNEHEEETD